jgi:hypothetical protein
MVLSKMFASSLLEYTVNATAAMSLGELLEARRSMVHYTRLETGRSAGNSDTNKGIFK